MKKRNNKIIVFSLLAVVLLIGIILIGRSYAFFDANVNSVNPENEVVKISTANVTVDYDGGSSIEAGGITPGWSATKVFTVKNNNTITEKYNIVWKEVMNTFENNTDLVYSISGATEKSETIAPLGDGAILINIEIEAGATHEYTLTMKYKNRGQETEANAQFYGHIKITKDGEEVRTDGIANQEAIESLISTKISNNNENLYPVGSVYISTNSGNPSTYLGFGEWTQWGQGRVPVGMGSNGTTNYETVEDIGGNEKVTLVEANLPSHNHKIPALTGTTASAGAHTHLPGVGGYFMSVRVTTGSEYNGGIGSGSAWSGQGMNAFGGTNSAGAHTHSVTTTESNTGSAGSGSSFNVMQPYITAYMWKRVS